MVLQKVVVTVCDDYDQRCHLPFSLVWFKKYVFNGNLRCSENFVFYFCLCRSFIEDSQANIKISPQDNSYIGLNDRLVTVVGTLQQQVQATNLILSRLSEDLHYVQSVGPAFPYAPPYGIPNYGLNGGGKKFQNNRFQNNKKPSLWEDISNSLTLGVPDEHIGIVVGRSGRNIAEISQISGARIKISERGDFIPGTSDRKVTIIGSRRAISVAEAMIVQKVASLSAPPPASTPES